MNALVKNQGPDKRTGKKTILFICPSLEAGGAERLLIDLIRHIDRSRFNLHLAVFRFRGRFKAGLPGDVPVSDLRKRSRLDFPKLVRRLAFSVLPEVRPDAVISFMWYANIVSVLARQISPFKPRLIVSEHTSTSLDPKHRRFWSRILMRSLYRRADGIVAVTEGLKRELTARHHLPADLIKVINNCVNIAAIRKSTRKRIREKAFTKKNGPIIVACGRLTPEKNFPLLIRAFASLPKGLGARLYIIGAGDEEQNLRRLIRGHHLGAKAVLLGFRENPYQYMAAADVLALSSHYEGFGNVIVEAMACGTAVVAVDCPFGPREIIEEGVSGLLVPPGDEEKLARALTRVLTDDRLRLRLERGGLKNAERFDVTHIVREYEKLLF